MKVGKYLASIAVAATLCSTAAMADLIVAPSSYVWAPTQSYWWGHINSSPTYYSSTVSGTKTDAQCEGFSTYCNTTNLGYNVGVSAGSVIGAFTFTGTMNPAFYNGYVRAESFTAFNSQNGFSWSFDGAMQVNATGNHFGELFYSLVNTDTNAFITGGSVNGNSTPLNIIPQSGSAGAGNYQLLWYTYITNVSQFSSATESGYFNFALNENGAGVPAPGALALLGLGLLGIGGLRRKKAA